MPFWVIDIIKINQMGLYLANEAKICNQNEFLWLPSVNSKRWIVSMQVVVMPTSVLSECARRDIITRKLDLDQMSVAHTHTGNERRKCNKTHLLLIILALSLDMTVGWFWWYLWPEIAFTMSQEFPTSSFSQIYFPRMFSISWPVVSPWLSFVCALLNLTGLWMRVCM